MAKRTRRNHSPALKAKVALAAVEGDRILAELAEQFDVPPNQIQDWKKKRVAGAMNLFGTAGGEGVDHEQAQQKLHAKIGQLTMEKDCLANLLGHGR
jgi:transposase